MKRVWSDQVKRSSSDKVHTPTRCVNTLNHLTCGSTWHFPTPNTRHPMSSQPPYTYTNITLFTISLLPLYICPQLVFVSFPKASPFKDLIYRLNNTWFRSQIRLLKHILQEFYTLIVGLRPPPPPVVPTFFLLVSFTFLFEDFYYSVKEYKKISVCCSSG